MASKFQETWTFISPIFFVILALTIGDRANFEYIWTESEKWTRIINAHQSYLFSSSIINLTR